MVTLKVTAAGASSTATLTAEDMAQLKVSQGDTLSVTKVPNGAYRLARCDDAVARQMPVAERIMHEKTARCCGNSPDECCQSRAMALGRNPWCRTVARDELARLEGAGRDTFLIVLDEAAPDEQVGIRRAMIVVLGSGEHRPYRFRGRKP